MDKERYARLRVLCVVIIVLLTHMNLIGQSMGIGSGVSLSHFNMTNSNEGYRSILGMKAHAFYVLDLSEESGFRFEFGYTSKGSRYFSESNQQYQMENQAVTLSSELSVRTNMGYIDFKPLFIYRKTINQSLIYGGVGPYIGIGVLGKRSTEQGYTSSPEGIIPDLNTSTTEDILFGASGTGFDFIDFGLSTAIGFSFRSFYTELSYDFGLNNIDAFNVADFRIMNRSFSLTVGYLIHFDNSK